jgi:16S rRNA (uracil1498-N3)-methyltransferase
MHLFYHPEITSGNANTLPETEMHHAVHVLRMKPGETLYITDGQGNIYTTKITDIATKKCAFEILSEVKQSKEWTHTFHMAIAPTKSSDRFDFFLEKAVELGIDEITPLICNNSERRKLNIEKAQQTLIAAMKQSNRAYLPVLHAVTHYKTFIEETKIFDAGKYIAHCAATERKPFIHTLEADNNVLLLIGPEGDFTTEEIQLAEKNNFTSVSLGEMRLRTETAGIFALQAIHMKQQWSAK